MNDMRNDKENYWKPMLPPKELNAPAMSTDVKKQ